MSSALGILSPYISGLAADDSDVVATVVGDAFPERPRADCSGCFRLLTTFPVPPNPFQTYLDFACGNCGSHGPLGGSGKTRCRLPKKFKSSPAQLAKAIEAKGP